MGCVGVPFTAVKETTQPPAPLRAEDDPDPVRESVRATVRRGIWARLLAFSAIGVLGLLVAYTIGLPPFPMCAFKIIAGRPCPGCGMTRSVVNLVHADVLASLRFHPLGIVMVGGLAAGIGGAVMGLVRGVDPVWDFAERHGSWVFGTFFGAMIAIWVVRAFLVPSWSPDPITPGGDWNTIVHLLR